MNTTQNPLATVLRTTFAALCVAVFVPPLVNAQTDEPDPWFEEQLDKSPSTESTQDDSSKKEGLFQRRGSPDSVHAALLKEYQQTPESALTKRIELLRRAVNALPEKDAKTSAQLAALEQTKRQIIDAIDSAGNSDPIEAGLDLLSPFQRVFRSDLEISRALRDSPFLDKLVRATKEASETNDAQRIASIRDAIRASGLSSLVGDRVETLAQGRESDLILQKWSAAFSNEEPLLGERFLIGKALRQDQAKLNLAIEVANHPDPKLDSSLLSSLIRRLGDQFSPATPEQADLLLTVEVGDFSVKEKITDTTKSSVVPGRIDEQANPEFVELVAKYEKAAKTYEAALETYEFQFENWLDNRQEVGSDISQMKKNAESKMQQVQVATSAAAPGSSVPGSAMAEFQGAQAELRAAEGIERLSAPQNLPEPVKPTPIHLNILERLYRTPSTIILSKEETPYDYTSQTIVATFNGEGSLAIAPASAADIARNQPIALSRERSWTRNINVDPRDPVVDDGDYSQETLQSTEDLFYLEFASECIKSVKSLLPSASETLLHKGIERNDPSLVVLALSLRIGENGFSLPQSDMDELLALAQDDAVSPAQFRSHCLQRIASETLANAPSEIQQVVALLH